MEADARGLGAPGVGACDRRRPDQRVVRHGLRRPHHQGMGPRVGRAQADAHWAHLDHPRAGGEPAIAVPLLGGRGQDGQVLGPRVQPRHPQLPRPLVGRLLPLTPPDARPPRHGRARRRGARVGRAHEERGTHAVRPPADRWQRADAGSRAAGHHRLHGQHCAAVGPRGRPRLCSAHQPQEGGARAVRAPLRVHLRQRVGRQHEEVEVPRGQVPAQYLGEQLHNKLARYQRGQRARLGLRQRQPALLGLEVGVQLSHE
mmetsp:Transcript_10077/g.20368  ORF Transcript_10077/g.20368 Transcript_10077/m.20368 type:complete len:258 (-) Transcript_10077:220-993(-)